MGMLSGESAGDLAAMVQASHQVTSRIALVAIAIAAVGVFTVLQIMARSDRRPPAARGRRARAGHDWRTLPPEDEAAAGTSGRRGAEHDGDGPLWRYGAPQGYGRDYGPGHSSGSGPGYAPRARPPAPARQDGPRD
jgi:hypothetical protein